MLDSKVADTKVAVARRASSRRHGGDRRAAVFFVLPAVTLLLLLLAYPLVNDVRLSLAHLSPGVDEQFVGLGNYKAVLSDSDFWHSVWVTVKYAVISLVIEFIVGFGLALLMSRIVRGGGLLRTLILIPTMLTPSVAAINFRNLLNYNFGLINYLIGLVGFSPRPWLASSGSSLAALVLTDVWRSTPFFVLVLSAGLLALSPEVMEASELDGASGWQRLIHVQVPMLVPLILVTVLFRVIDLFRTFDTVFTLTNGGPGNATNVTSMQIYTDMYVGQYTSYAATEAVVFLLLTLVVSGLIVRLMRLQRQ
jgi:multiple sugar transport system permease protein